MPRFRLTPLMLLLVALTLLPAALTSCRHKALLCPDQGVGVINVSFDADAIPSDIPLPEGMTLYFYPLTRQGRIWRFDIAGSEGGRVELPYGSYQLVAVNNDRPRLVIGGAEAASTFVMRMSEGSGALQSPPGYLFRALTARLDFSADGLTYSLGQATVDDPSDIPTLVSPLQRISTTYCIEIRHITGLDAVTSAQLTLSGIAGGMNISTATPAAGSVTLGAPLSFDRPAAEMTAQFEAFSPLADATQELEVRVTLASRRTFQKKFDVTAQVANNPAPQFVLVIIDGLDIPPNGDDPSGDVGIQVGVDGWTEIITDYITDL